MGLMAILNNDGINKIVLVAVLYMSDLIVTHVRYLNSYSEVLKKFVVICKWVKSCLFISHRGIYTKI